MSVAVSRSRLIENAVKGLIDAGTEFVELVAEGMRTRVDFDLSQEPYAWQVEVKCDGMSNANLGALGGGAYWQGTLMLRSNLAAASDQTLDRLHRAHGACERYLSALSVATLNTALTASGITVHGMTGVDEPDIETYDERGTVQKSAARMLHFSVS